MTGVTVKGLQKNGVNAVAKHFVGECGWVGAHHGRSRTDDEPYNVDVTQAMNRCVLCWSTN